MAEYIEREEVIDAIENFLKMDRYYHPYGRGKNIPIKEMVSRVNEIPSADVQPVKHGRWDGYGTCSACGDPWDLLMTNDGDDTGYWYEMPPFCPNCGARMDGET